MIILTDKEPRGLGYLEIDHRATPAELPPGTPRHFEADTYTCSHCQYVVVMNPNRVRERYKCHGCNHHICDNCAAKMAAGEGCLPFAKLLEEKMEETARQVASGLILP